MGNIGAQEVNGLAESHTNDLGSSADVPKALQRPRLWNVESEAIGHSLLVYSNFGQVYQRRCLDYNLAAFINVMY